MNSFVANNKNFFSFVLFLLLSSSLCGITFNNEPLKNIIRPGDSLLVIISEKDNFVTLNIKDDNIDIAAFKFTEGRTRKNVVKLFKKCSRNPIRLKSSDVLADNFITSNSHIIGGKINIKTSFSLLFKKCLFEVPDISIAIDRVNFKNCFLINPCLLTFFINDPRSDYEFIQIFFHEQTNIPTVLAGSINRWSKNNPIEGLCLSNVKEIIIGFNPTIWNNN